MIGYIVIEGLGPSSSSSHLRVTSHLSPSWFRIAGVFDFRICALNVIFFGRNQANFLTVDMALTWSLVLLCSQHLLILQTVE